MIGDTNYDDNLNVFGKPMSPAPQAQYSQGQVIEVDVVLTAHHMGHFEFSACPIEAGGVATASCLEKYPLEFVSDPLYGAPKDTNYPYRAYIAPPAYSKTDSVGTFYRFQFKLPDNLSGNLVLLQWHYLTANSCTYAGYSTYPYPKEWGTFQTGTGICDSIPPDGRGVPEQFWNCAEISISTGPTSPSTPAPIPAPTPTTPTTYYPSVTLPTGANPPSSPSNTVGTCAEGKIGNGICPDPLLCCSPAGYCGTSEAYCGSSPAPAPKTPVPTRADPAPSSAVGSIPFPDYATGVCSGGTDNVMTVNVGYYQSWAIYRDSDCNPVFPDEIDVLGNGYTHLTYAFASINSTFQLEPWGGSYDTEVPLYATFNSLKDAYPGLKTMMAVGGWTFNDPGETQTRFSDTASTAANRAIFAASCVEFCQTYNFDGIDLDWEYPGDTSRGGTSADKTNFGLLIQAIRDAFDAAAPSVDLQLSVATPIADFRLDEGYDLPTMAQGLDFFNIMTYDIHGKWDNPKVIGANSDMPYIFDSVKYFLDAGVAPSKLVLGLAAYGRTYTLSDTSCATAGCSFSGGATGGCAGAVGIMPYFSVDEYVQSGTFNSLKFNATTGTMELVVDDSVFISYDSPETFEIKYSFASKSCLRGIMWWAVDMKKEPIRLGTSSIPAPAPSSVSKSNSNWREWQLSTDSRCGISELDARGNCRMTCKTRDDCPPDQDCWRVHSNYCGSKPQPEECNGPPGRGLRCGQNEVVARETCGTPCSTILDCDTNAGEYCFPLNPNFCDGCSSSTSASISLRGGA